jgi:hypothetical protein
VGALLGATAAMAQTGAVNTATGPVRQGNVVVPERLTVTDSSTANLRPLRPERPILPPAVLTPVQRFKLEARAYLQREEALKAMLQGANDQDRAAIRERIQALREQWFERARELRKEFKERSDELAARMPDRQELFNSIRDSAVQPLQEGHIRPRNDQ